MSYLTLNSGENVANSTNNEDKKRLSTASAAKSNSANKVVISASESKLGDASNAKRRRSTGSIKSIQNGQTKLRTSTGSAKSIQNGQPKLRTTTSSSKLVENAHKPVDSKEILLGPTPAEGDVEKEVVLKKIKLCVPSPFRTGDVRKRAMPSAGDRNIESFDSETPPVIVELICSNLDLLKQFSGSEMNEIQRVFRAFDVLKKGTVDAKDLELMLIELKYRVKIIDMQELSDTLSENGQDKLTYEEFLFILSERHEKSRDVNKYSFSEGQLQELLEAFSLFDSTGNGRLDEDKLTKITHDLHRNPCPWEIELLLDETATIGLNKNGEMDFLDFVDMMGVVYSSGDTEQEIREAFQVFEKENKGMVSISHLRHALTTIGDIMTDEEVDVLIDDRCLNCAIGGEINTETFVRLLADMELDREDLSVGEEEDISSYTDSS